MFEKLHLILAIISPNHASCSLDACKQHKKYFKKWDYKILKRAFLFSPYWP